VLVQLLTLVREPLSEEAGVELAGNRKALSDPVRLRLLGVVAGKTSWRACVRDLSADTAVGQPTISHHEKVV
jgi:ArsR family transcriptional regulator